MTAEFCSTPAGGSWRNYDLSSTTYERARFFKRPDGVVRLQGLVLCGGDNSECVTGNRIFILPPGYRPAKRLVVATDGASQGGTNVLHTRIDIAPDGGVVWYAVDANDKRDYITLSGISFRASP